MDKNIDKIQSHSFSLNERIDDLEYLFKVEFERLITKWKNDDTFSIDTQRHFAKFLCEFPNKVRKQAKSLSKHLSGKQKK